MIIAKTPPGCRESFGIAINSDKLRPGASLEQGSTVPPATESTVDKAQLAAMVCSAECLDRRLQQN